MQHRRNCPFALIAILCANTGWASEAADLNALRKTIREGDAFFQQGKYQQASERFLAVWSQAKVPTGAWWAAQTYERLGDWAKAAQFYTTATLLEPNQFWTDANTPAQRDAQEKSKARLDVIKERVPQTLRIECSGNATNVGTVLLDGLEFPKEVLAAKVPIAVGAHQVILVGTDGTRLAQRAVDISENQQAVVTIQLATTPSGAGSSSPSSPSGNAAATLPALPQPVRPAPVISLVNGSVAIDTNRRDTTESNKTMRRAAYSSFGVGVAGLLAGATAGVVTLSKYSELKSKCGGDRVCDPAIYDEEDSRYDAWRAVSTAGFIVGGVGAALGGTLFWLSASQERTAAWNLLFGPGAIRVDGSF